jgi:ABC-type nitrate/sulfonate/bicarbonate transport system substrate-binding protein
LSSIAAEPVAAIVPPEVNVIYFARASVEVTPDARVVLNSIVDYLRKKPDEKISLSSFVDPTGTLAKNKDIIAKRSDAVKRFFVEAGIGTERVEVPPNSVKSVPPTYPVDDYWRLRKVVVSFSSKAMELSAEQSKRDDLAAEEEAKPEKPSPPRRSAKEAKTSATAPATGDASEPKQDVVDVLYWRHPKHALLILAKALGYFRDEHLEVRLHESNALEASQITVAVAEGTGKIKAITAMDPRKRKYFMGAVCPYGFHDSLAKNIPLVQIGGLSDISVTIVMKKELAAAVKKDLRAFAGHTIARVKVQSSVTTVDYVLLFINALKAAKIPHKEKWYSAGNEIFYALKSGEVDAVSSGPPYDHETVEKNPDLALYEVGPLYNQMPCCRQLVTRDQLKDPKTREKYVRFERALIRAHMYYEEHKAEASEIVARVLRANPAMIREIFMRKGFALDPNPNTKGAVAFYDAMREVIGKQEIRESIDTSVYEEALLALAKESPKDEYFTRAIQRFRQKN